MAVEKFPVEGAHVRMFAYAVGDDNPVYNDEEYAKKEGFQACLAPPTFAAADVHFDPDSFLRRRRSGPENATPPKDAAPAEEKAEAASGGGGGGGGGTGLHAEQHYEYHRPLRVGDVLTKTTFPGETWEREGRRAGKLVFSEMVSEYRDQHGELVLTARMVGVRTERPVDA